MASPHTAGMLAYLLSIYPSISFDPPKADFDDIIRRTFVEVGIEAADVPAVSSVWNFVRAVLPSWLTSFGQMPMKNEVVGTGDDVAPIPGTLSPKQLKAALLALATKGVLTDLPSGTPNLVSFTFLSYHKY